jgi:preprotein translocase subunit SecF
MQFLTNPKIDFMTHRRLAMAVSAVVILAGIASLVVKGGPNYSVDFTGGTLIQIRFPAGVAPEAVREVLSGVGLGAVEIVAFGGPDERLIRIPAGTESAEARAKAALRERWPDLELRREETVGPKIGGELRSAAIQATILALVLILIYVTMRFEFRFAVAAIIALIHDVLVTLAFFSFTDRELSLSVIAAFLTIVGFSINDTIVIFDRVRENLRVPAGPAFLEVMNRSVNQTLSRTIITSGTVLLTVFVLLFFGGEVLEDFSFAMVVGLISGTYSTVFVAAPLVVEWELLRPRKRK